MTKFLRTTLTFSPVLLLLIMLIISADRAKAACFDALLLCGRTIIPALFPFFVLSALLTKLGLPGILGKAVAPVFSCMYGISPAGASALVMGFIGGYPSGANYIADMQKSSIIDTEEGERLIAFCNNSGPAFIVGVMGSTIFGSVKTGLILYSVHIFSSLLTGLAFRSRTYHSQVLPHRLDEVRAGEALVSSVKQAVGTITNVCGFILFFSVLVSMLETGHIFSLLCNSISERTKLDVQFVKAAITGIFELGSAAGAMQSFNPSPINLALAAGILGWGGLSVHFQTLAVLSESKIKGTLHLTGRLINACISFLTMFILSVF